MRICCRSPCPFSAFQNLARYRTSFKKSQVGHDNISVSFRYIVACNISYHRYNISYHRFISSMLETATGAWIGLNDRESESRYMWNFQQSATQTFLPWGKGEPSNYNENCNIENCVAIKSSGKWNDVICGSFYPYVCQVSRSSYNGM